MTEVKENKMATMPINKLLISMALPMMISMLVQALYNVVDSVFVAKYSADAMTSISLVFPIQSLMIAVAAGLGVGVNALLSRSLGAKDYSNVKKIALNAIFLAAICSLIFLVVGLFFVKPYMASQTSNSNIAGYGAEYLFIICCFSFGIFAEITFERLLQATGKSIFSMITQLTGAVINIILDPILIFGLFGAPEMGIAGAAIATVIGQCAAGTLAIIFNIKFNKEINLNLAKFLPDKELIGKILYIGVPSILMASLGSIMVLGINAIISNMNISNVDLPIDDARNTSIAVFGIYFKLQSFVYMPVFGLNNGMVPIVAFNFGAKNKERMMKTIKLSVVYAFILLLIGLTIFQTIPNKLLVPFANESNIDHIIKIGVPALKTISLSFLVSGFCIICLSVFQSLGNGVLSMFIAFARQIIILVPVAFLLSLTDSINNVWYAFFIAEIGCSILCIFAFRAMYNKVIKPLSVDAA